MCIRDRITPLSEMLAKRRETLGSETRFEWPVDDEKSFWVLDPTLATDEWRDELIQLQRDFQSGEILPSTFYRDFIEMMLDGDDCDQSEEYLEYFEGFASPLQEAGSMLMKKVNDRAEEADPTQQSSRSTRRSSKRR